MKKLRLSEDPTNRTMAMHLITASTPSTAPRCGPDTAPRNTGYPSATPTGLHTRFALYVTRIERFQRGDFPMVCVRSGLPATKMVPVQARRTTVWP